MQAVKNSFLQYRSPKTGRRRGGGQLHATAAQGEASGAPTGTEAMSTRYFIVAPFTRARCCAIRRLYARLRHRSGRRCHCRSPNVIYAINARQPAAYRRYSRSRLPYTGGEKEERLPQQGSPPIFAAVVFPGEPFAFSRRARGRQVCRRHKAKRCVCTRKIIVTGDNIHDWRRNQNTSDDAGWPTRLGGLYCE